MHVIHGSRLSHPSVAMVGIAIHTTIGAGMVGANINALHTAALLALIPVLRALQLAACDFLYQSLVDAGIVCDTAV